MKKIIIIWLAFVLAAFAQLNIPGADGSDGAMNFTADTEIDLGLAAPSAWNTPGTGNGVYDANQWAVVFKASSLSIDSGVTVTFKNHPSRAPVVILISGSATIQGTLSLNGGNSQVFEPGEPGPGGFRANYQGAGASPWGHGMGPSGGIANVRAANHGDKDTGGPRYGSSTLIPLVGGSGGHWNFRGSGGGAILIAATDSINLGGDIAANGGNWSSDGSGGAIRIVANTISGSGTLSAVGGDAAGDGRVRIQANNYAAALVASPETVVETPGTPVKVWPTASLDPSTRIVSIGGNAAPADPRASMGLPGADTQIGTSNAVNVVIETKNLPTNSEVFLRVVPRHGNSFELSAIHSSGTQTSSTWNVAAVLPKGYNSLIVRAVSP